MHQAEGSGAENQTGFEALRTRHRLRVHHAGQRFEQRRLLEWQAGRLAESVAAHHMGGQQQKVRIRAHHHGVDHLDAEVFLAAPAEKAFTARRRRRRHQLIAGPETSHAGPDFGHHAGELVPKGHRKVKQRMAAAVEFQIGAATQRTFDLEQNFSGPRMARLEFAHLETARLHQHHLARRAGCRGAAHSERSTTKAAIWRSGSARSSKDASAPIARRSRSCAKARDCSTPISAG